MKERRIKRILKAYSVQLYGKKFGKLRCHGPNEDLNYKISQEEIVILDWLISI